MNQREPRSFLAPLYRCDGCGRRRASSDTPSGDPVIPPGWAFVNFRLLCTKCKRVHTALGQSTRGAK